MREIEFFIERFHLNISLILKVSDKKLKFSKYSNARKKGSFL